MELETGSILTLEEATDEVEDPWNSRVAIPGSRKIWHTKKSTKVAAVFDAIKSLTDVPTTGMTIKRKYKEDGEKKIVQWFFVVRAEESVLVELENVWPSTIHQQIGWQILPLLKFPMKASQNEVS